MIISKKKFEREVERRVAEFMHRREQDEMMRELRREVYSEMDRLHNRLNGIEAKLNVMPVGYDGAGRSSES